MTRLPRPCVPPRDRLRVLGGSPGAAARGVSSFAVTAPFAGTVIEKKAVLGTLAVPSEPMFTVADLSRVWIQADLPEAALAKVRVGANAKVTVPAYPGETFDGRVGYIGAGLDKETRTVAARIEVANADGRLKPRDVRDGDDRGRRRQARGRSRCRTRRSC